MCYKLQYLRCTAICDMCLLCSKYIASLKFPREFYLFACRRRLEIQKRECDSGNAIFVDRRDLFRGKLRRRIADIGRKPLSAHYGDNKDLLSLNGNYCLALFDLLMRLQYFNGRSAVTFHRRPSTTSRKSGIQNRDIGEIEW